MDLEQVKPIKERLADQVSDAGWGVNGVGLGRDGQQHWHIVVNMEKAPDWTTPPFAEYEGVPVVWKVVGRIEAL